MEGQAKTLYFRRKNKTCYALELRRQPLFRSLLLLLAKREAIPQERLLLFSRGQQLTPAFDFMAAADKQIVHIVDEADVQREVLTFHLRFPNRPLTTHTLPSSTLVRDFIIGQLSSTAQLAYFQLGLVYLGKIMHPRKTLREEYLENEAEIIVVNIKEFLRGKHIDKVADIVGPVPTHPHPDGKELKQQQKIQETPNNNQKLTENVPHVGGSQQGEGTPSEEERTVSEESAEEKEESNAGEGHPLFNANNELAVPESKDHSIIAVLPTSNTPTSINPAHAEPPTDPNNDPFPSSLITEPPLSELDLVNAPECQFRIKVSEVHSVGSDQSHQNLVTFHPDEEIEAIDELRENAESEQPSLQLDLPRQSLKEYDLSPGDFMLPAPTHPSESSQFIDKVLKDYKFLFEST